MAKDSMATVHKLGTLEFKSTDPATVLIRAALETIFEQQVAGKTPKINLTLKFNEEGVYTLVMRYLK